MTQKPEFDPARPLCMAKFKTVLGHDLPAGRALSIVDDPAAPGEVDRLVARRLWLSGFAVYQDEHRPTPVETPEQEKARIAVETLRDGSAAPNEPLTAPEDLRGTKKELLEIAADEGVTVESDDNKADLIRKIIAHRAASASKLTDVVQDPPPPNVAQDDAGNPEDPTGEVATD